MESKEEGLPGWVRYDRLPGEKRNIPPGTAIYTDWGRPGTFRLLCVTASGEARWYLANLPNEYRWGDFNPVPPGLSLKEMMQYVEVVARLL